VTTPDTSCEVCERARLLYDAGRREEALAVLQERLRQSPEDGRALNDAGAMLYAVGRFDEAADLLKRAAACLAEERGQALWNLAEVYLASGRPAETLGLFDEMSGAAVLTADLANRTAAALLDRGDLACGIEAMIRSFRLLPGQHGLLPMYEKVRAMRPKIAFLCDTGDTKFINEVYAHTAARFETRFWRGDNPQEMLRVLQWCDIAWFEWCTEQAVQASRLPKVCRSIVRLHRFEAFRPWPEKVRWENIDCLVTVGNSAVHQRLLRNIPDLPTRTRVVAIPNGVDLARYGFVNRPRGKNLACVARIHIVKNPMLLLHAFQRLHAADPEFRLFFAGNFQDDGVLEDYLRYAAQEMGLTDAVRFDGWQEDVAAWLEDKHYVVSSSIVEGHPVNILEGMARGLKPVIHIFPGCREFFPPEYLWRTADEFRERILSEPYRPEEYRGFVAGRFPLKTQLDRINSLFLEFERNPVLKAKQEAAEAVPAAECLAAASPRGTDASPRGT
jgi:glycosyltransferase involved in cell wall biosynthesis